MTVLVQAEKLGTRTHVVLGKQSATSPRKLVHDRYIASGYFFLAGQIY